MWKPLFAAFVKETAIDKAFSDTNKMLALTEQMFLEAKSGLREQNPDKIEIDIYETDSKVNKLERKIRKKVQKHLERQGGSDIYPGLLLVSVIIDIERLGDESKNVLGLAKNFHSRLKPKTFKSELVQIEEAVEDSFARLRKQFKESDADDADKMLNEYNWVNKLCDTCEMDLIKESNKKIQPSYAVALALYIRHLKRINGHLRNIATSIVSPFDRIGFAPKKDGN